MAENKNAQWPITNDDKKIIQDLGRKLHKFVLEYAKTNSTNGSFHAKLVFGAFQYLEGIFGAKAQLIADDVLFLQESIEKFALGDMIVEPFQATPTPSLEQAKEDALKKKADIENELAMIEEAMKPVKDVPADATPSTEPIPSPYPEDGDQPSTGATA